MDQTEKVPASIIVDHEETSNQEASIAVASAQIKATIEARFLLAVNRPRDIDAAAKRIFKECEQPLFAAKAKYAKPIGKSKVVGPSIRFAECAMRNYGNIDSTVNTVFEDDTVREILITVCDLETNTSYSTKLSIQKTIERKHLGKGQKHFGHRINSYGEAVYLVRATEDDMSTKVSAISSKASRSLGLKLIPSWITDEAMRIVDETNNREIVRDKPKAEKGLLSQFAELKITRDQLMDYLGHEIKDSTPEEISELRAIFEAIKDGETTWSFVMELKNEQRTKAEPIQEQSLKEALKQRMEENHV